MMSLVGEQSISQSNYNFKIKDFSNKFSYEITLPKKVSADDLVKIDIDIINISLKDIDKKTAEFKLDVYNSSEDSQNRTYIIEKDFIPRKSR